MKTKKRKYFLLCICILIAISIFTGVIDYILVRDQSKPFFCIPVSLQKDGGSGKYLGLGYSFKIKGNFMPESDNYGIAEYQFYILGIEVVSSTNK